MPFSYSPDPLGFFLELKYEGLRLEPGGPLCTSLATLTGIPSDY